MKRKQIVLLSALLLMGVVAARAQEKPASKPGVPATVTVVFNEFAGEKKIGSLPYSMPVNIESGDRRTADWSKLRMGVRVPVTVSGIANTPQQVQYMDVGTSIDCRASLSEDGQYVVELQIERTSIYSVGTEGKPVEWSPDEKIGIAAQPIIRQYRSTMTLLVKDGQTIQRSVATDPLSGRMVKVDVTLSVVK